MELLKSFVTSENELSASILTYLVDLFNYYCFSEHLVMLHL